jgi:hypothetical protein
MQSPAAIALAAGVTFGDPWCNVNECFPDGQIKVEAFGLQCVGFDQELYQELRRRFEATSLNPNTNTNPRKRRAEKEGARKGGFVKARAG